MSLPSVDITRQNGQLNRVQPVDDRVIGLVLSGVAVDGKIALGQPMQIFGTSTLDDIGITAADNAFARTEIQNYYAKAGEGMGLWFMLANNTTLLSGICDPAQNIAKKLLDAADGNITHLLITRQLPDGYVVTRTEGLDTDVWNALTKLEALAVQYDADNAPFVGIIYAIGFTKATAGDLRDLNTGTDDYVALCLASDGADGKTGIGTLGGWITSLQVHQNIGRVASGSVLDAAYFPDGTPVLDLKDSLGSLYDKRYIIFRKIRGKSGYFYADDPSATKVSSDFSSVSWNAVINKAKRIAYGILIEHLNDDTDTDPSTGGITAAMASDWEGEIESAIKTQMITTGQIKGVKCLVDTTQTNLQTDQIKATIEIVRKGQSKKIEVAIGYTTTV